MYFQNHPLPLLRTWKFCPYSEENHNALVKIPQRDHPKKRTKHFATLIKFWSVSCWNEECYFIQFNKMGGLAGHTWKIDPAVLGDLHRSTAPDKTSWHGANHLLLHPNENSLWLLIRKQEQIYRPNMNTIEYYFHGETAVHMLVEDDAFCVCTELVPSGEITKNHPLEYSTQNSKNYKKEQFSQLPQMPRNCTEKLFVVQETWIREDYAKKQFEEVFQTEFQEGEFKHYALCALQFGIVETSIASHTSPILSTSDEWLNRLLLIEQPFQHLKCLMLILRIDIWVLLFPLGTFCQWSWLLLQLVCWSGSSRRGSRKEECCLKFHVKLRQKFKVTNWMIWPFASLQLQ